MSQFTDNKGFTWSLDIKVRDVERVRNHVTGSNGKPLDLLELAERGDFSGVSGSVQTILKVVFWLCFDEITRNFDRVQWDADHKTIYELVPDEKGKTPIQKAADWWGERIGGEEVLQMVKAWEEAILNFIPNPRVREAVKKVMTREEVYQEKVIQVAEEKSLEDVNLREAQLGKPSTTSRGKSGSRRVSTRSGS